MIKYETDHGAAVIAVMVLGIVLYGLLFWYVATLISGILAPFEPVHCPAPLTG